MDSVFGALQFAPLPALLHTLLPDTTTPSPLSPLPRLPTTPLFYWRRAELCEELGQAGEDGRRDLFADVPALGGSSGERRNLRYDSVTLAQQ